jgi:hypothetical protein
MRATSMAAYSEMCLRAIGEIVKWPRTSEITRGLVGECWRQAGSSQRAQGKRDGKVFITGKKLLHVTFPFDDDRPEFRAQANCSLL